MTDGERLSFSEVRPLPASIRLRSATVAGRMVEGMRGRSPLKARGPSGQAQA
ncbi:hypothetical protein C4K24_3995 [Pseudomonas chlororaphis subsp. aurantiaca]|nr:hypothetical protein C4K24_3995 [Pseudomonas chlororaphis subsp. aurantiaca]